MRPKIIIAGILIVLGIVVLAYSSIRYKIRGTPVDIGPLYVETTENHFIPPIVAGSLIGASCCLSWTPGKYDGRDHKGDKP